MPTAKYGRTKTYGRRRYRKRKPTFTKTLLQGASTATKAYAMAKSAVSAAWKLKGIINSERKKKDVLSASVNADESGQLAMNCVTISQGDTVDQRNGNSILAKYLSIRGRFELGTSLLACTVQVFVIQDNQQVSDNPPSYSDIFDTNYGYSLMSKNTAGRYTILASKVMDLNSAGASTDQFRTVTFDLPINHHIRYNGTAGTDIQKGGLYVFVASSLASGAAVKPKFVGWSRVTYYDN